MASKETRVLTEERARLRAEHTAGASGIAIVRGWSDCLDRVVTGLWEGLAGDDRCALVALGEYGRREPSPTSYVDLLVLRGSAHSDPSAPAKALSEELWEAGLEATLAVRSPREALERARSGIESETAFLDGRFLAGNLVLFEECQESVLAWSRQAPEGFLNRIRTATGARHLGEDDASACLEPDVLEGRGGLLDLATVRWIELICGPQRLAVARRELVEAADFLHRLRNQLHYCTERNTDLFQVEYHRPVAEALAGPESGPAPEVDLLRSLYERCRRVAWALECLLSPEMEEPEAAARFRALLPRAPAPDRPWPPEAREIFLGILAAGAEGRPVFRALDQWGALVQALPEWEAIRCLPPSNAYHRYAVDVHSFEVVTALVALGESHDQLTRQIAEAALPDRELLALAGLLHAIGKGTPDDHTVRGERLAGVALRRMGAQEPEISEIAWLVRNHLLLSETATRRDIGDENMVMELADQIGSLRRLRLLYLLSVADGLATGPSGWSAWKGTLVSRLFLRVAHVLERGELAGEDASTLAQTRREEIREAMTGFDPVALEHHLDRMPRAWLLSQSLGALVDQSRMMLEFRPAEELSIRTARDLEAETWEVLVVGEDRPGLFGKVSGTLALHDLNVLG
ncbi:MAG: HD domain-containing protein, partial [Actinomycetota bacterium]